MECEGQLYHLKAEGVRHILCVCQVGCAHVWQRASVCVLVTCMRKYVWLLVTVAELMEAAVDVQLMKVDRCVCVGGGG
jgi:hypothetical protein